MHNKKGVGINRRHAGVVVGLIATMATLLVLNGPRWESFNSPGPMNTGHETLACNQCHLKAEGTIRQQLQANMWYLFGVRESQAAIGHNEVTNNDCLACHSRPKDHHPVFRFYEPRYSKARQEIQPHQCNSCHQEHSGQRVTIDKNYCRTCHEKLNLKKDPLDISHRELIEQKRWATCLECHDFHGNHRMTVERELNKKLPASSIDAYFQGGKSPYSEEKRYTAKKERTDIDG